MTETPESPRTTSGGPRSAMQNTPNAERYVLEADAMRRRQLRSALLHGSRRTWRDHPRTWPAVVVGIIVVAVIIAGLAVTEAFKKTSENEKKQEQDRQKPAATAPAVPGPAATSPAAPPPTQPAP
jgi:flagellar biosynthesis/type III secretory pathway M-ring protein FliF/YscJ